MFGSNHLPAATKFNPPKSSWRYDGFASSETSDSQEIIAISVRTRTRLKANRLFRRRRCWGSIGIARNKARQLSVLDSSTLQPLLGSVGAFLAQVAMKK